MILALKGLLQAGCWRRLDALLLWGLLDALGRGRLALLGGGGRGRLDPLLAGVELVPRGCLTRRRRRTCV